MTQPRARRCLTCRVVVAPIAALLSACALRDVPAGDPCRNPANEIVGENCLQGHPATEWDINGYGDPSIQGFGTDIAIAQGESVEFKVDTDSDDYRIDIYRMGYYGGTGARRVDSFEPSAALPQTQPECLRASIPVLAEGGGLDRWPAPLVDCGNWTVSASWQAPADASVDGGVTWHPATGRASWRFEWKPGGEGGEVQVLSRAVDDSGNLEVVGEG